MPGGFRSGDVVLFPWSQAVSRRRALRGNGPGCLQVLVGGSEELQEAGGRVAFCIYRARSGEGGGAIVRLS